MPFEKFDEAGSGRGGGGSTVPKISLRRSGSIGINRAALEEFFDEDDEAVVLYFDEEENRVGLRALKDKEEESSSYTLTRSNGSASVAPQAFMKKHDLVPDITTQYSPELVKQNQNLELVAINLDDPIGTYGSAEEEEDDE
jgi:hypothetical protein